MSTYPKNTKNGMVYDYWNYSWYTEIVKNTKVFYQISIFNREKDIIKTTYVKLIL